MKEEKGNDKPLRNDKIINNTFNQGEQNYEDFGTIKIHDSVFSTYEDQLGDNIIENRILKELDEEMYAAFKDSPYYEKYNCKKRADRSDRLKMYYYFKDRLFKNKKYTNMEFFISFAEFFEVNYDQLYEEVSVLDKESLLRELNEKYKMLRKIKTKRLF